MKNKYVKISQRTILKILKDLRNQHKYSSEILTKDISRKCIEGNKWPVSIYKRYNLLIILK